MQISHIQLEHIDFTDFSFSLLPEAYQNEDVEHLKASINRVGVLQPPIVKEGSRPFSYQIIAGRKRLTAALSLDLPTCTCLTIPSDFPGLETWEIIWEEAVYSHPVSSLEQAVLFEKVSRYCSIEKIAERFLPSIGISSSLNYINKKIELLQLEDPLQIAIHEGRLNEQVGLALKELPFADRMALFEVIGLMNLSVGNQKKLIRSCRELAGRERTTVLSILSRPELSAIINDSKQNTPQKAGLFMRKIHEKRYPRLTEAEADFHRFISGLALPENIRIDHDPSFEKDELKITVACSSRQELSDILARIQG